MPAWLWVMQGIASLLGLANFALALFVLVKLHRAEGATKTVLALLCGIYLIFWGWDNAGRYGFTREMRLWILCMVAQLALVGVFMLLVGA